MATCTYPKGSIVADTWGTRKESWGEGYGTRYKGKSLPSTKDDRDMSIITQHGCSASPSSATYAKKTPGHKKFPKVAGLP